MAGRQVSKMIPLPVDSIFMYIKSPGIRRRVEVKESCHPTSSRALCGRLWNLASPFGTDWPRWAVNSKSISTASGSQWTSANEPWTQGWAAGWAAGWARQGGTLRGRTSILFTSSSIRTATASRSAKKPFERFFLLKASELNLKQKPSLSSPRKKKKKKACWKKRPETLVAVHYSQEVWSCKKKSHDGSRSLYIYKLFIVLYK